MLEKLREIEKKYREIEARLSQSETYADRELFTALSRERAELEPLMETYGQYLAAEKAAEEAEALLSDQELGELAREEWSAAKARRDELGEKLKTLLMPADPLDGKNVIVEIRAGVGGEESALFASQLYRMYSM